MNDVVVHNSGDRTKTVLRWIAMVPAAILGAALGGLIAYIMTSVALAEFISGLPPQVNEFARDLAMAGFFVYTGTLVAPREHMAVPISLAAGWCAGMAAIVAYAAGSPDLMFTYGDTFAYVTSGLSCLVAIVTAVVLARDS